MLFKPPGNGAVGPLDEIFTIALPILILGGLWWWSSRAERRRKRERESGEKTDPEEPP